MSKALLANYIMLVVMESQARVPNQLLEPDGKDAGDDTVHSADAQSLGSEEQKNAKKNAQVR